MKRKYKSLFTVLVIVLFALLIAKPVLAEDIYDTTYEINYYEIPWGNGIDDDGDGIIDNIGEPDVQYGDLDVNITDNVVDNWNESLLFQEDDTYFERKNGVSIASHFEQAWLIESSSNASVSPTEYPWKYNYTMSGDSYVQVTNPMINVVTFFVQLQPNDVMNGCQEMWYRSPICWDDSIMDDQVVLNIYNEDDELVFASTSWTNSQNGHLNPGQPNKMKDVSVENTSYYRIYYRLMFDFRTNTKYRFEEYIETDADAPINEILIWMSPNQDTGNDELTDTYVFWGTDYARKIPAEAGWGIVCTVGIGPAGTEKILYGSDGADPFKIYTQTISGNASLNDPDAICIILPLRTTEPVDIQMQICVESGSSEWNTIETAYGVTGTLVYQLNISDPDAGEPNTYTIIFTFAVSEGNALAYSMYPSPGTCHMLSGINGNVSRTSQVHYAVHFEIAEFDVPQQASQQSRGPNAAEFLVGIALIIIGVIVGYFVFTATLSASMITAGALLCIGSVFFGSTMVAHSFTSSAGLENYLGWLSGGLIRAAKAIWKGVTTVLGGLWSVIIQVVEAVKWLGNALLKHGGDIVGAIVDIVYLITFFAVIWLTQKFLLILTGIAENNPSLAFKQIIQLEGGARAVSGRARKVYAITKKTGKASIKPLRRGK